MPAWCAAHWVSSERSNAVGLASFRSASAPNSYLSPCWPRAACEELLSTACCGSAIAVGAATAAAAVGRAGAAPPNIDGSASVMCSSTPCTYSQIDGFWL